MVAWRLVLSTRSSGWTAEAAPGIVWNDQGQSTIFLAAQRATREILWLQLEEYYLEKDPNWGKGTTTGRKPRSWDSLCSITQKCFREHSVVGQLDSFWWSCIALEHNEVSISFQLFCQISYTPTFPLLRLDLVASVYTRYWLLGRAVSATGCASPRLCISTKIGHWYIMALSGSRAFRRWYNSHWSMNMLSVWSQRRIWERADSPSCIMMVWGSNLHLADQTGRRLLQWRRSCVPWRHWSNSNTSMRCGTPQWGCGAEACQDVALPALTSAFAATLHWLWVLQDYSNGCSCPRAGISRQHEQASLGKNRSLLSSMTAKICFKMLMKSLVNHFLSSVFNMRLTNFEVGFILQPFFRSQLNS